MTLFELVENAKPLKLTITRDVGASGGMFFTAVANACGITEDAVAQRLFDFGFSYLVAMGTEKPASLGGSVGDALVSIFPEIGGEAGLLTMLRQMSPGLDDALGTPFNGAAFDFRNFIGEKS